MKIEHDQASRRFQTILGDEVAYIEYDDSTDRTLDLQHTIVPEDHEGQGVASELTKHALDYARRNKLRVVPTCPFIAAWISRNPDYEDVVAGVPGS